MKIPYIKRVHEVVNSKLGSHMTYNITVAYDNPNAVKDPDVLRRFDDLMAEMNKKVVTGELKSFSVALVAIGILMALVFAGIRIGLIGMIPNVTPLIILAGFMGYFNYSLDMFTMTIIPILLGIAVDDSIHFVNQIKFKFEKCGNYRTAILSAFYMVGKT